jgi:hypothetical protein
MPDPIGGRLDVTAGRPEETSAAAVRPFLQVLFNCCRVYQRVYQTADGGGYLGRCPRCGRAVRFTVGPGGTDARQFVVE